MDENIEIASPAKKFPPQTDNLPNSSQKKECRSREDIKNLKLSLHRIPRKAKEQELEAFIAKREKDIAIESIVFWKMKGKTINSGEGEIILKTKESAEKLLKTVLVVRGARIKATKTFKRIKKEKIAYEASFSTRLSFGGAEGSALSEDQILKQYGKKGVKRVTLIREFPSQKLKGVGLLDFCNGKQKLQFENEFSEGFVVGELKLKLLKQEQSQAEPNMKQKKYKVIRNKRPTRRLQNELEEIREGGEMIENDPWMAFASEGKKPRAPSRDYLHPARKGDLNHDEQNLCIRREIKLRS